MSNTCHIIDNTNPFYVKLKDWYGKNLNPKKLEVLHSYEVEGELVTVIFMMEIDSKIEIARVILFGDVKMEISIDCQADVRTLEGAKKLIQYGGNFKLWEIED